MNVNYRKYLLKSVCFITIIILFLSIYYFCFFNKNRLFFDKLDGSNSSIPIEPVYLKELTNFNWDYAKIMSTEDAQNIWFYKDGEIVFSDAIKLESDGSFSEQVIFGPKSYCSYEQGKVIFKEKMETKIKDKFVFFYKTIDCEKTPEKFEN